MLLFAIAHSHCLLLQPVTATAAESPPDRAVTNFVTRISFCLGLSLRRVCQNWEVCHSMVRIATLGGVGIQSMRRFPPRRRLIHPQQHTWAHVISRYLKAEYFRTYDVLCCEVLQQGLSIESNSDESHLPNCSAPGHGRSDLRVTTNPG